MRVVFCPYCALFVSTMIEKIGDELKSLLDFKKPGLLGLVRDFRLWLKLYDI
jgi:hypothetical protein